MKKVPAHAMTPESLRKRLAVVGVLEQRMLDLEALSRRVAKAERLTASRVPDLRADAIEGPTLAVVQ
jgi:hypothetical protein